MFGKRPDGRLVKGMDPIVEMIPYFMPTRVDSQVFFGYDIKYENIVNYIVEKGNEGYRISFMEVIIAAFVRGISQNPEINRFIMNKKLYARNELVISLVILKEDNEETVAKVYFDPYDTIYDVCARIKKTIAENRKSESDNGTMKAVHSLMRVPGLPNFVIQLSRLADRFGLLPKSVIDIIPFHTSMFFTNVASIGLDRVYHHIYNYGTTSIFISMGNIKKKLLMDKKGIAKKARVIPMGITVDERVRGGAVYSNSFIAMKKYLEDPRLLEIPPEKVVFDKGCEYSCPKPDYDCIKIKE